MSARPTDRDSAAPNQLSYPATGQIDALWQSLIDELQQQAGHMPGDIGLLPDGDGAAETRAPGARTNNIVDPAWTAITWTLARALRTSRFWWIALGYFCALYAWYGVQVHQTKYLTEIGVSQMEAAWALGLVSLLGVPGQIIFGHVSDRIGREWVWTFGCAGFVICYVALIALQTGPTPWLGYSFTSVLGPNVAEIFEGSHFSMIFGTVILAAIGGRTAGPWVTGLLHDLTGNYNAAFWLELALCFISAASIWRAGPRKVRLVAGGWGKRARHRNDPLASQVFYFIDVLVAGEGLEPPTYGL